MSNALDDNTNKAINSFGDSAAHEYLRLLHEEKRLCSTQCQECHEIAWPPRPFCPFCHHDAVAWVDIGEGATLYAFTTQGRAVRFRKPEVIGMVDIPKVGRIFSHIDAPLDALQTGMPLKLGFVEIQEGVTLHKFTPVKP